ncbi:serine protease [Candidatus Gracilibacteria bacterium]|nr:serine protease [Candidatus Gracilibacteria bacterium]
MKYIIYLLAGIYIIGGIYLINTFFINKKIDINNIKKSIVIIIPKQELISYKNNPNGLFKNINKGGIGAGFFISNDGKIQTVSHILTKNNIVIYNGKKYNSKIIKNDIKNDLAILKINYTNNNIKLLNKNNSTKNKQIIYSFGVEPKTLKIIYNTGILINNKSKLNNKLNLLEISNNIKPGFSGGPILNSKGEIIGINYAISENKKYGINLK